MTIYLLDDSISIDVFYEKEDKEYKDNICVKVIESCADHEKLFRMDEVYIYLSPEEARALAKELCDAAEASCCNNKNKDVESLTE